MNRALLVTLHDVAPATLPSVRGLRDSLARWGVERVTLLAVPQFHGGVRLADDPATARWLRERSAAGDEVALHGYYHVQAGAPAGRWDQLRARLLTAREGECLAPREPLAGLLQRGREELRALLGAPPAGFVAPAWLEPRGLGALLAQHGFAWHETSLRLEALAPQRRALAPVIGYATRSALRQTAALAWSRALALALGGARLLRVAVHPADNRSPAVLRELERVVRHALRDRRAVTTSTALAELP